MVAMMNPNAPFTAHDAALDSDPAETAEWCQALESSLAHCGPARARYLLQRLQAHALELGLEREAQAFSAYRNTLPVEQQGPTRRPGAGRADHRYPALERPGHGGAGQPCLWRTGRAYRQLRLGGGDLRGRFPALLPRRKRRRGRTGDLVFFQPHSAPGIMPGRFSKGV
jgi:pyruvate dehydrogenase E1 component